MKILANVRLLRQSIEDYQKKYDTTAKDFNARYNEYTGAVDDYNAEMDKLAQTPGATAYVSNPDGTYSKVISKSGKLFFARTEQNIKGVKEVPTLNPGSRPSTVLVTEGPDKGAYAWTVQDGKLGWYRVQGNNTPWFQVQGDNAASSVQGNNVDRFPVGATEGGPPPLIYNQPVAPKEPDSIRPPNITVSGSRELQNPGMDQSQLNLVGAKGILGKSNLVADQQPAMRGSAFADPNDPKGLKERGVLTRVLAGQL